MRHLFFFLFLFSSSVSHSADIKSVLEKMQSVYSSKDIGYNTTYKLFKGHSSTKVHTSYTGKVISKGGNVYQKIKNTEFIYSTDFFLKISQDEKIIALDVAQKNNQLQVDLSSALNQCSSKSIDEVDGSFIVELILKNSTQLQCSKIVLKISTSDYTLRKLDIYYTYLEDFSTSYSTKDLHQPRLSIEFTAIEFNPTVDKKLFDLSKYILTRNGVLSPAATYVSYELLDHRIKR